MGRVTAGDEKRPRRDKGAGAYAQQEGTARPPRMRFIIESASATEIRKAYGISDADLARVRKRLAELGLR